MRDVLLERELAEARAEIARLGMRLEDATADARASEMMLKQVCDERDELRRAIREALEVIEQHSPRIGGQT